MEEPNRRPESPKPGPVSRRAVGLLMLTWTALMLAWFLYLGAAGTLTTTGVKLAVGGLVGGVWLIGLLMLAMFLVSSPE